MATQSIIGYKENNNIIYVSCHFDGYYSYNGRVLLENYKTLEQVKELVSFGDMSSLGEYCIPKDIHSFEHKESHCTVYYGRDRGESGCEPNVCSSEYTFFSKERFAYLFKDNEWFVDQDSLLSDVLSHL